MRTKIATYSKMNTNPTIQNMFSTCTIAMALASIGKRGWGWNGGRGVKGGSEPFKALVYFSSYLL